MTLYSLCMSTRCRPVVKLKYTEEEQRWGAAERHNHPVLPQLHWKKIIKLLMTPLKSSLITLVITWLVTGVRTCGIWILQRQCEQYKLYPSVDLFAQLDFFFSEKLHNSCTKRSTQTINLFPVQVLSNASMYSTCNEHGFCFFFFFKL